MTPLQRGRKFESSYKGFLPVRWPIRTHTYLSYLSRTERVSLEGRYCVAASMHEASMVDELCENEQIVMHGTVSVVDYREQMIQMDT